MLKLGYKYLVFDCYKLKEIWKSIKMKNRKKQEKQTNKWNRQVKRKLKKLVIKITRKYLINLKCQAEIKKFYQKKLENL